MINSVSLQKIIADARRRKQCAAYLLTVVVAISAGTLFYHFSSAMSDTLPLQEPVVVATPREQRLRSRLHLGNVDIKTAIEERTALLAHSIQVAFVDETGETLDTWSIAMIDHPSWIHFEKGVFGVVHARISEERVVASYREKDFPHLPAPVFCTVLSTWKDAKDVVRAQTDCTARAGVEIDTVALGSDIAAAIERGDATLAVRVTSVQPTVYDPDFGDKGRWTLLASGHSNFKGSGMGRKANIRKALSEKLHNVLIPEGATFSFNDALGGNISNGNGWHDALTIFEGVDLRPAPGGGVCQASTTLFRAVLRAGLPVVEQKNHSLYVTYYEAYGVGQDATIFPGLQDFRFTNDTGAPILLQAYYENNDAFVQLYGVDDGRSVALAGPYFAGGDTPAAVAAQSKTIRTNEIAWVRSVLSQDKPSTTDVFVSRYNAIPRSLRTKYTASVEQTRVGVLHAAAIDSELSYAQQE